MTRSTSTTVLAASILASAMALAAGARAEVVDVQPHGFVVRDTVEIAASKAKVWKALTRDVGRWWSPVHSWTGDAANLYIDTAVGGCFCETLAGGGHARHLDVVYVEPENTLRLSGALGPLSLQGVAGGMTIALVENNGRTVLTQTYKVGGYLDGGGARWAPLVDGVLKVQFERLGRFVETGSPAG